MRQEKILSFLRTSVLIQNWRQKSKFFRSKKCDASCSHIADLLKINLRAEAL